MAAHIIEVLEKAAAASLVVGTFAYAAYKTVKSWREKPYTPPPQRSVPRLRPSDKSLH